MQKFLVLALILSSPTAWSALRITIDPGHGGSDNGAVHDSVKESQIVLSISKKLHSLLKKDKSFKSQLLRTTNEDLALENRVKMAHNFDADLFISIHANANPNTRAKGAEFYIQNQLPMNEENLFLAHHETQQQQREVSAQKSDIQSILFDLKKNHKVLKSYQLGSFLRKNWPNKKNQMIRQGPFYVLSQTEIPSVIVEVGYLSHPQERNRLKTTAFQNKIAHRIYNGLKDYLKNKNKLLN